MSMAEEMSRLCRWDVWANRLVLTSLRGAPRAPAKALAAFQHVLAAEVTWLRRIDGSPDAAVDLWGDASLPRCEQWFAEAAGRLARLADRTDDELADRFTYQNSRGVEFSDVLQRSMMHMLMHSSQYRGEAAGFLNHSGHEVGDLDYIGWLRSGEPD